MVDPLVQILGKGISMAWNSVAARDMARKTALRYGPPVLAAATHSASVAAQEKVTEMERAGEISEKAADTMRATLRAADVATSLAAGAVAARAGEIIKADDSAGLGDAVQQAARQPGQAAKAFLESGDGRTARNLAKQSRYLISGEDPDDQ